MCPSLINSDDESLKWINECGRLQVEFKLLLCGVVWLEQIVGSVQLNQQSEEINHNQENPIQERKWGSTRYTKCSHTHTHREWIDTKLKLTVQINLELRAITLWNMFSVANPQ